MPHSKKTVWVLGADPSAAEVSRLKEVTEKHDFLLELVDPRTLTLLTGKSEYSNKVLRNAEWVDIPDIAIPAFIEDVSPFNFHVMRFLEEKGVFLPNKVAAIETCLDKFKTTQALMHLDIPLPKTILLTKFSSVEVIVEELGFPLVLKPSKGSKGKGVVLVNSVSELKNHLELLFLSNLEIEMIAQEFIADSRGHDLRVLVIDSKPLACMKRTAAKADGFRSNYSQGGSVEAHPIDKTIESITRNVCQKLDLRVGGIDLLIKNDGSYVLCEVNSSPGFAGIEKSQSIDIAQQALSFFIAHLG